LNQQIVEKLIEKAVNKAIKEYSKEKKTEQKKKAFHNTKLLLKNYHKIQASIEGAVSEERQLEQESIIQDDSDELYIESIRKSKLKSLIVIAHMEKALATIQEECKLKGVPEKYDAFKSCMLDGMTYDVAAICYLSSKTSISRWINEIINEASIQLFGVDGVDLI
jgi:hypothetical protein